MVTEKLQLLKLVQGQQCTGVNQRQDDQVVELHFPDFVVQITGLEHVYVSTIKERL